MYSIAIDGPAGAGKSTIAKTIAKKLEFIYVDTGAMYRAMALYFIRHEIDPKDEEAINKACPDIHVSINYEDGVQQVLLNGENVNGLIRTEEVGNMASKTSAYKMVRATLLDLQRNLAKTANILMDGRDIGTNVLPNADLKIYLTASSKVRAERRYKELVEKGVEADFDKIEEDIIIRDRQDMEREIAPLKQAEDAVLVDSSDMTIEEVVDAIVAEFRKSKIIKSLFTSSEDKDGSYFSKNSRVCFGVKRAVDTVYKEAGKKNVYTYGPIIHNSEVVNDLKKKGVEVINSREELEALEEGTVIIRSHGVAREIYDLIHEKGLELVDATCPFVRKIHKIVEKAGNDGDQVIIVGSEHHPEVQGIKGWCTGEVHIISDAEQFEGINLNKPTTLVSQTTFNYKKFQDLVEILNKKGYDIGVCNTICNATEERQLEAKSIAKGVDAMVVIGDKQSSNSQKLYEISKKECENTFFVQTLRDLDLKLFESTGKVGITAGASTPQKIIKEVHASMTEKSFEELLEESFVTIHNGEVVKGTVIDVKPDEIILNIGYKADGILTRSEYSNDSANVDLTTVAKVGDTMETKGIKK